MTWTIDFPRPMLEGASAVFGGPLLAGFLSRFRSKSLAELPLRLDRKTIIQRTRILVIDDASDDFPFEILRREGYAIDHWKDVDKLSDLESGFYDIIVLDIGGIGQSLSNDEGVGILRHIKAVNPAQVVVAYSGQSHQTERIPFFRLADHYVPKPANALLWKETLDNLIDAKITVQHYWAAITAICTAKGVSRRSLKALESKLAMAATAGDRDTRRLVSETLGHFDNVATVVSIAAKLLGLIAV